MITARNDLIPLVQEIIFPFGVIAGTTESVRRLDKSVAAILTSDHDELDVRAGRQIRLVDVGSEHLVRLFVEQVTVTPTRA